MRTYLLSFRLNEDTDTAKRRFGLLRALQNVQLRYWDRTEHAVVFETTHTLSFLGALFRAQIDPSQDLMLLCQIGTGEAVISGANSDPDIFSILPGCRDLDA